MRKVILTIFIIAFADNTTASESLQLEAQGLTQQFVGQLKPQLKKAMTEGGPALAIEVCASAAPKIADSLSAKSGWIVRRVSLKSRNASRASPNDWERAILEQLDQRQTAGETAANLNYSETVGRQYRYMQAQGVEPLCLICHGENLSEPVRDTIMQYYPDDQATGYKLGQIRGAISLTKEL
ncbi:MAG: DUF3365 domain-containing protein [Halioglobus sp.]